MEKSKAECPHCGEAFTKLKDGRIPTHDFPRPCRSICPGAGEPPRSAPDAPLWKDDPAQRERDFLDTAGMELQLYGFAVVKQVATLRGDTIGTMDCPLCGRKVRYSVAKSNGHCSAVCERDGCIKAME